MPLQFAGANCAANRGSRIPTRGVHTGPVEVGGKDGLHEIAVGEVVGPGALALEAGGDGVVLALAAVLLLGGVDVHVLVAHSQVGLEEVGVDDGTGDAALDGYAVGAGMRTAIIAPEGASEIDGE